MGNDGMCHIHVDTVYGSSNLSGMHFYFELLHSKFGKYVHRNREIQIKLNRIFRRCACANVCAILIWQRCNFADSPFLQFCFIGNIFSIYLQFLPWCGFKINLLAVLSDRKLYSSVNPKRIRSQLIIG